MHPSGRLQTGAQAHQGPGLIKDTSMKRLHVHVSVEDIPHSIGFYSALFAAKPVVVKPDYAKWMLDDPRVNFAISTRGRSRVSTISASRSRTPTNCTRSMRACARPAATLSSRARPPAVTPNPRSRGSTIPPASPGRRFTPPAKARSMATEAGKTTRVSPTRKRAHAARPSRPLKLLAADGYAADGCHHLP